MKQHAMWVVLAGIPLTLVLVGCAPMAAATPTPPPVISGELTVLDWSGFEVPEMWVDFAEAHPDVEVEFQFAVSDEDFFNQTRAVSGADIVHIYTPFLQFYLDENLIQEIDTSRITYWDQIPAEFQALCTVEGKVYCVPWDWGQTSILYRTDKLTEPPTSWDVLFDEEYAGHIGMWDSGYGAHEIGSYVLGYELGSLTDAQFEDIRQLWVDAEQLEPLYWLAESEIVQAMSNGDIWVSYGWNASYRTLREAGVPIGFATPEEGRSAYVGMYAITTESDNTDAALRFIDLKLAEQSAVNLLNLYAYGHVIPDYYGAVTDEVLVETLSLDDPAALERLRFNESFSFETFERFTAMWQELRGVR